MNMQRWHENALKNEALKFREKYRYKKYSVRRRNFHDNSKYMRFAIAAILFPSHNFMALTTLSMVFKNIRSSKNCFTRNFFLFLNLT